MQRSRKVLAGLVAAVILCGLCAGLFFLLADQATRENLRSSLADLLPGRQAMLRGLNPVPIAQRLAVKGFVLGQPAYLRLFKEEKLLEVWMERDGGFELAVQGDQTAVAFFHRVIRGCRRRPRREPGRRAAGVACEV